MAAALGRSNAGGIAGGRRLQGRSPRIGERAAGWLSRVAGGDEALVEGADGAANLRIDERRSLIYAEGAASNHASSKARGKIGEEFAAVVVHAPAGADDDFVVKHFGAPGNTETRAQAPLAASESGIADAFAGELFVIAGDEKAGVDDGVGGVVVVVFRGIEIVEAAIFFGEAAVLVEAKAGSEAEVGREFDICPEKDAPVSLER